jgi:hypothetical protein
MSAKIKKEVKTFGGCINNKSTTKGGVKLFYWLGTNYEDSPKNAEQLISS